VIFPVVTTRWNFATSLTSALPARAAGTTHHVIDYEEIIESPIEAASKTVRALDLRIDDNDIERNLARLATRHAKHPIEAFSRNQQRHADPRVHAEHRQGFDDALVWAESALGPQRAVVVPEG
jgi:hypothetical protein